MSRKKKRSERDAQIRKKVERTTPLPLPDGEANALDDGTSPEPAIEGDSIGHVLLVDDNAAYRASFRRRLMLEGYEVVEAPDSSKALELLASSRPDIVITDLSMRSETEGLDLIRQLRTVRPLLPAIMISAVGTFEEGAEASRLGAFSVVSKARIDQDFDRLLDLMTLAQQQYRANMETIADIHRTRSEIADADPDAPVGPRVGEGMATLQSLLGRDDLHPFLKGEAFDALLALTSRQLQRDAGKRVESLLHTVRQADTDDAPDPMRAVRIIVHRELPGADRLDPLSMETLLTAEFLFQQQQRAGGDIDFSRNVSFSYCFVVENESKVRLKRRLARLLGHEQTFRLIEGFLERDQRYLSLFYHQFILQSLRGRNMDITVDNVRQTLQRMLEYRNRYKPDGLKALGVMILCFGRTYSYFDGTRTAMVDNPLGLRGLESDVEALDLADLLISLQHFRNPYIHPEITEPEKIPRIRTTTYDCLRALDKIVA